MKSLLPVRILFSIAAIYDGLLGLVFIFAAPAAFRLAGVTPPNHWGYVHFAAGMLVIFALIFLRIARDPAGNRALVIYGILLKACYVATVAWHEFHGGVPSVWKVFAVCDAAFLALFVLSLSRLRAIRR